MPSTISSSRCARPTACSPGLRFDRERLEAAASDELLAATEVADLLVRKGMPFREAHGVVGGLVREALERGVSLSELDPRATSPTHSDLLDDEFYEVLTVTSALESKAAEGGTSSARVAEQIAAARDALAALRDS